jgi:hypothetical protein
MSDDCGAHGSALDRAVDLVAINEQLCTSLRHLLVGPFRPGTSRRERNSEEDNLAIPERMAIAQNDANALKGETIRPTQRDVIFGRGAIANRMRAGSLFRALVEVHAPTFARIPHFWAKREFVERFLVNPIIREQRGRFLKRASNGKWLQLRYDDQKDRKEIQQRVIQALRDTSKNQRQSIRSRL